MDVPTIDLKTARDDADALKLLDAACRDHGFFIMINHGIDEVIDAMWRVSREFFNRSAKFKRSVLRSADQPLGYYDRELTKRLRDQKEVFDYMEPRDGGDRNQWPAGEIEFRSTLENFFREASEVAATTLDLVYWALGREIENLPKGDPRTSNVRLNYYPVNDPLEPGLQHKVAALGDMALHHHTDPGILTLLIQDMTGGLQTLSQDEGWIDVPPVPGSIVVNLGDALQVWSNDTYKAAVHRVLPMSSMGAVERFSTPYFFSPHKDAILEPIPTLSEEAPRYRSFTWQEYIKGRVDDNYADLGEDDIQISQFRLTGS
jgi:isopenicillin N synthase-like dioxygenase